MKLEEEEEDTNSGVVVGIKKDKCIPRKNVQKAFVTSGIEKPEFPILLRNVLNNRDVQNLVPNVTLEIMISKKDVALPIRIL